MAPSYPRGSWFEQTWISSISGSFHINISFPGPVVLEKKIFKDFPYIIISKLRIISLRHSSDPSKFLAPIFWHYIDYFHRVLLSYFGFPTFRFEHHWRDIICRNAHLVHQNWYRIRFIYVNLWSPIVAPSDTRGSWFEQTWISIISGSFHINFSFTGSVVLEKKIFKWHHPIFAFSWLSPLWRGAWSFIWTNLNPLHPRMICTKFGWIWPIGSWEEVENVKS